jgi:glutathione S-transferase
MIRLYQFAPAFDLPNASPFCMKVETLLRMSGLPFECDNRGLLTRAPKGKLPFIEDEGEAIGDSGFILAHLKRKHGVDLDAGLDEAQRSVATAFERLFCEHLYWAAVYTRWIDPGGFEASKAAFFGRMRWPMRALVPPLARRGMKKQLWGHGMGRHSPAEIVSLGCEDIDAVAGFLGDKAFFFGDTPSSIDATAYAFLANLLWVPIDSALATHAREQASLAAYCQRMRARYYP